MKSIRSLAATQHIFSAHALILSVTQTPLILNNPPTHNIEPKNKRYKINGSHITTSIRPSLSKSGKQGTRYIMPYAKNSSWQSS